MSVYNGHNTTPTWRGIRGPAFFLRGWYLNLCLLTLILISDSITWSMLGAIISRGFRWIHFAEIVGLIVSGNVT